jgi:hypothetical protein
MCLYFLAKGMWGRVEKVSVRDKAGTAEPTSKHHPNPNTIRKWRPSLHLHK